MSNIKWDTINQEVFIEKKDVVKDLNNNNNHTINRKDSLKNLDFNSTIRHKKTNNLVKFNNQYTNSNQQYPYENAYFDSFLIDINDNRREKLFFHTDEPINIKITDHEQESSLVLLHTTVYIINIKYLNFNWTIRRRFKNFIKLYEAYALFKAKLNIKNVAVSAHLHANTARFNNNPSSSSPSTPKNENIPNFSNANENHSKFKPSDHFKLIFQSIASDFNQAKNILEKFLQDVVDHKLFRNHNETLKFLEVSHLSFIADLGDKNKEGLIKKHSFNIGCCHSINFDIFWDTRWLVIKDTWIGYLNAKTGCIKLVFLVDQGFKVLNSVESTNTRNGLLIENLTRTIVFKCHNERQAQDWRLAILNMALTTGEKFFNMQRFGSFSPVRENSLAKWFVDGCDYMESVADSIESAKEEIFITGFFISPEIYLKRPVIVGDKWRLDKLLQRKAEEGVKIYILIYKEIELTLPINSAYSKRILSLTHKNIKVLRHPDHLNEPNQFMSIMWAHHEKLVVIDQSVAYFGGIDLCYGRWDNHLHKLTDMGSVLPSNVTVQQQHQQQNYQNHQHINEAGSFFPIDDKSALKSKDNSVRLLGFKSRESVVAQNSFDLEINSQTINYDMIEKSSTLNRQNHIRPKLKITKDKFKSEKEAYENSSILNFKYNGSFDENEHDINKHKNLNNNSFDYQKRKGTDSDTEETFNQNQNSKSKKQHLKRSRSLDMSFSSHPETELSHSISESSGLPISYKDYFLNKKFKLFKNSIKSNTQNLKLFNREYAELPIINKLKKIKQFKDNLKRYKFRLNINNDNSSELNYSMEQYDDEINRSFEPSSSEQILNYLQGSTKYWIGKDYCNFIFRDVRDVHSPFKDSIDRTTVPRMPWHDVGGCVCGPAARDIARHFIQRWNYIKTKKVKNNPNYVYLLPKSYKNYTIPIELVSKCSNCNVQVLRSVSTWSAGISKTESSIHEAMKHLIQTSKHYIYIENQFFISLIDDNSVSNEIAECLYNRILKAYKDKTNFKVYIFLPLIPGYEGEYGKSSGVLLHAITHYNNSSINGLIKKLADSSIEALNYLCFFSLRTWSELNGKLVSELIYVHSKLMIVDDRACIIGSANINDRSLLGNRDSEIALYIEDTQFINGILNKKQCEVGRFSSTLRQRLFKEFLGEFPNCNSSTGSYLLNSSESMPILSTVLTPRRSFTEQSTLKSESIDVTDPCSDEFYKQILIKYAAQNTRIYDLVFKSIPSDYVSNFQQLKEYQKQTFLSKTSQVEAKNELNKIKGYIVLYPYRFLCFEDLTPQLGTKEKLMPSSLWT